MNRIDTSKPLEAVHTATGRVVPLTFDKLDKGTSRGGFYTTDCPDSATSNSGWYLDGTDYCAYKAWTIRNVANTLDLSKTLRLRGNPGASVKFVANTGDRLIFEIGFTVFGTPQLVYRNLDGTVIGARKRSGSLTVENADDIINKVSDSVTFWNVYSDGSIGTTMHRKLADAQARAKVGKVRVGILELLSEDGTVIASRYHAAAPSKRTSGYDPATFKTAPAYPTNRAFLVS